MVTNGSFMLVSGTCHTAAYRCKAFSNGIVRMYTEDQAAGILSTWKRSAVVPLLIISEWTSNRVHPFVNLSTQSQRELEGAQWRLTQADVTQIVNLEESNKE